MKTRSHWTLALSLIGAMAIGATSLANAPAPRAAPTMLVPATDTIPFRGTASDTLGRTVNTPGRGNVRWECQDSVRAGTGVAYVWPVTVKTGTGVGTVGAAMDSAWAHDSISNCHDIVLLPGGIYASAPPGGTGAAGRYDSIWNIRWSGQTARGEGATFNGYTTIESRGGKGHIFEYFRIRYPGGPGGLEDIYRLRATSRTIIQHISSAWPTTNNNLLLVSAGTEAVPLGTQTAEDHTVWANLTFEPHIDHATHLGIGGGPLAYQRRPKDITVYQNFFNGPGRRMPRLGAAVDSAQVIHNIAYNWSNWPGEANGNADTGPTYRVDWMGYLAKPGPASYDTVMPLRIGSNDTILHKINIQDIQSVHNSYTVGITQDSLVRGSQRTVGCSTSGLIGWCAVPDSLIALSVLTQDTMSTGPSWAQFAITPFDSAAQAVLLERAGNSRQLNCDGSWTAWGSQRDSIDARAVAEYHAGTGVNALLNTSTRTVGTPATGTLCADADSDVLPDAYETAQCGTTTCIPSWGTWVNGRWAGDWYLEGCNLDGTLAGDRSTSCSGADLGQVIDSIPAFAGAGGVAFGWGATALSGVGGSRSLPLQLHFVTNTNNNGAGSFFNALMSTSDTTYDIIMFRTGGRLAYYWGDTSDSSHVLSHVYVAGQTAPGGGFIYGIRSPLGQELTEYGQDIVIRYLSGQKFGGRGIRMCGDRVVLDHLSISRTGADPTASNTDALQTCQRDGTPEGRFGTFTVSNNLLGDAHMDGNSTTNMNGKLQTVARNYGFGVGRRLFNINSDTAALSGFKLSNNVVYNWGGNGAYAGIFSTQVVGSYTYNYIKPGPATPSTPLYRNAPAHWQDLCSSTLYPSGCDFSLQWEGNRNHINSYTTVPADTSWANGELRCRNSGVNEYIPDCTADDNLVPTAYRRNTDVWAYIGQAPYWPYTVRAPITDAYVDSILADAGNSAMLNCDGTWSPRRSTYDSLKVAQFTSNTGDSVAIDWDYITHAHEDSVPAIAVPAAGTACAMVTTGQGEGLYHAWLFANGFDSTSAGAPPADSITASGYLLIEHMLNGSDPDDPTPWTTSYGGGGGAPANSTFGAVARYVYLVPAQEELGRITPIWPYSALMERVYWRWNQWDSAMVMTCTDVGAAMDSAAVQAKLTAWSLPFTTTAVQIRDEVIPGSPC